VTKRIGRGGKANISGIVEEKKKCEEKRGGENPVTYRMIRGGRGLGKNLKRWAGRKRKRLSRGKKGFLTNLAVKKRRKEDGKIVLLKKKKVNR